MAIVMGIIFFLSHQSGNSIDLPQLPFLDKFLHAGIYFTLGLTTSFAVSKNIWHKNRAATAVVVVVFCFLYGISDEFHQSFTPGRYPSWSDIAADVLGAFFAAALYFFYLNRKG